MKFQPILSIVIPTRNRAEYAKHCIKSILDIDFDKFELVVHDNSDTKELFNYISDFLINDDRLIYRYDNSPMNTVHNFNKAMNYVNGEYICFIGDDDGIMPDIIEAVKWAKENNVDAIAYNNRVGYLWPNKERKGLLNIYPYDSSIEKVNVRHELECFLNDGAVYYLNYKLPKVYHGIVRKTCFDTVNQKLGYYFGGLSVDIFASLSLSLVIDELIFIDYPFTIAGSSAASEQTHRTADAKNKKLKDAPHFKNRGVYYWSNEVPELYSGATIWAESGIQALREFESKDFLQKVNLPKLAAHVTLSNIIVDEKILNDYLKSHDIRKYELYKSILSIQIKKYFEKSINRLKKIYRGQTTLSFSNVENIKKAINIVDENKGKNFSSINLPNLI